MVIARQQEESHEPQDEVDGGRGGVAGARGRRHRDRHGRGGDDSESPVTGAALDQASAVALEHTDGGRVTETEVGDEESYYEVEVTLEDGSQVDVQLDEDFNVVSSSADDDRSGEDSDDD
jgi:uncharacterized membrane protein YkoI